MPSDRSCSHNTSDALPSSQHRFQDQTHARAAILPCGRFRWAGRTNSSALLESSTALRNNMSRVEGWRGRLGDGMSGYRGFLVRGSEPHTILRLHLPLIEPDVRTCDGGLLHVSAGSAPTLKVSRPAQRSLTLRPVCSRGRKSTLSIRGSGGIVTSTGARLLPAGATLAGWESHPLKMDALARRTRTPLGFLRAWPLFKQLIYVPNK